MEMRLFLTRWLITTIAVLSAAHIVPGIHYDGWGTLLVASLVLGLVNAVLRPFLLLLSLPLLLLTFGLFTLVINSLLLLLVSHVVRGFDVAGWSSAFWGSLVISVVNLLLRGLQPRRAIPVQSAATEAAPSSKKDKVIDV